MLARSLEQQCNGSHTHTHTHGHRHNIHTHTHTRAPHRRQFKKPSKSPPVPSGPSDHGHATQRQEHETNTHTQTHTHTHPTNTTTPRVLFFFLRHIRYASRRGCQSIYNISTPAALLAPPNPRSLVPRPLGLDKAAGRSRGGLLCPDRHPRTSKG